VNVGKPKAIICDIDGTIALRQALGRGPYDMTRVSEDLLNLPVALIVRAMYSVGYTIVFSSGRDESARYATHQWLEEEVGIMHFDLLMRDIGDVRDDATIKKEMLDSVRALYDVAFALDDRNRVVDMWRAEGVPCFQVCSREEGNF
jgi:hypothetical protein